MGMRVVETRIRSGREGEQRLRVDLHGVCLYGPGEDRTAVRWEWIEAMDAGDGDALVVRSSKGSISIPAGTFGLTPHALAERLEQARSITARTDVIAELAEGGRPD
ncbi:MAG: hypothetical protein M3P97_04635 [Actinomycetota bacterium]|nr:hypothetical protein [Actinomycetota bacterium]